MKKLFICTTIVLSLSFHGVIAQTVVPKGYQKGSITLADNSTLTGFIKEDIRRKAAVTLISADGSNKKNYDGDQLKAVVIDSIKFICIRGDFFKLLCEGEVSFLQKSSDASDKAVYAGNEAMFINGTPGKPGDYFLYNSTAAALQHITNRNVTALAAQSFINCEAAISKAKESTGNIAILQEAVVIYNNRNK